MMRKSTLITLILLAVMTAAALFAADDITIWIKGSGGKPALAVIDFKGTGASQQLMEAFNSTLFSDLQSSGLFDMRAKSQFPLNNPQRPEDLRPDDNGAGFALQDWSAAPVSASHLVFGYAAAVNGSFALYGNVDDARQANPQSAQLMAQRYAGSLDQAGAIRAAHEFASDIIQKFGGSASLLGSRIYYVRRTGTLKAPADEVWVMDWDGGNPKQLTRLRNTLAMPAVSPDGNRVAFTSWAKGTPQIMMIDTLSGRPLPFYNQEASVNSQASFTPDGKEIYYASSAAGLVQIFAASIDGQGFRRISRRDALEAEPKVNPKNPNLLLMSAGPGHQQIYQLNADGSGVQMVTNGEGEASNPAWNPDGQHIAFSWTRGYAKGDFNVFVMDFGSRQYVQLTHSEGRNENPVWAPDGRHLVFASTRSGKSQIYSMLADGSQVKQLTKEGDNRTPVWGVK
jgi:TolB protein